MRITAARAAWPITPDGFRRRRNLVCAFFFSAGAAALPLRCRAQATDPTQAALGVWTRFLKAASANDLDSALACLSPGGKAAMGSSLKDMSARGRLPDLSRDVVDVSAQSVSQDMVTVHTVLKLSETQHQLLEAQMVRVGGAWLIESF